MGWSEYDTVIISSVALNPSMQWSSLDHSVIASTLIGSCSGWTLFCQEFDLNWEGCALRLMYNDVGLSVTANAYL